MDIADLIKRLGTQTAMTRELYKKYKASKDTEEAMRYELMDALTNSGMRSAKTEEFTASIAKRPSVVVTHEQSVLEWLKEAPDIETDQYIGLRTANFKALAMSLLKGTGEVIPGTEVVENESITIKANKKEVVDESGLRNTTVQA
jgi:hypothetical protein